MKILKIISNFNIYYFRHAMLCLILHFLHSSLFPNHLFFPFSVYYFRLYVLRHYLPSTFFTIQRFSCRPFVQFNVLSVDVFFTVGDFYFDLMPVNRNGDKTAHKSRQKVMTVFNVFGCFVWKTTGCLSFLNVKFYDSDVLKCTVMKLEYIYNIGRLYTEQMWVYWTANSRQLELL
jgi:hypothetical protein